MICPYCEFENIAGADTCENCSQDLTSLDQPSGSSPVEASIMEMPIARLHPRPPVIVDSETTVRDTIAALCEHRIGCVLVGTQARLEGIFSERDVLLRVADGYDQKADAPVAEFMTPNPETLEVQTPIAYALNRMSVGDYRHIPVTDGGELVGVISLRDIVSFLSDYYPDLIPPQRSK